MERGMETKMRRVFVGLFAVIAAAVASAALAQGSRTVTFEAEAANKIIPPFHVEFDHLASGRHCVVQSLHTGRPPVVNCSCTYRVRIPAVGRYHVWGRAWWPNGCANSVDVRFDNGPRLTLGQDGTYTRWHWVEVRGHAFTLSSGIHTFQMLNREDGPEMDEFYLTTDEDDVPAGIERPTPGALVR